MHFLANVGQTSIFQNILLRSGFSPYEALAEYRISEISLHGILRNTQFSPFLGPPTLIQISYLENRLSYRVRSPLILSGRCSFYLVFLIFYGSKTNGLTGNWHKPKILIALFSPKVPYIKNGLWKSLYYMLILIKTWGFYIVFHMIYRPKTNQFA